MKRARKKQRVMEINERLPEDLLILILARLPVKDILRYRTVSKSICALIDDPKFVVTHLNAYKKNIEESLLLVTEQPVISRVKWEKAVLRRSDTFRKVMNLNYPIRDRGKHRFIHELAYVNGLMLLHTCNWSNFVELILWNPSINKAVNVPCSVFPSMERTNFSFGLGYDAHCNDYKVVAIIQPTQSVSTGEGPHDFEVAPSFVKIYSLSTNSWTTKACGQPPTDIFGPQVFLNGAIHWVDSGSKLVVFDVCKEVFSYMEYPKDTDMIPSSSGEYPIIWEGSLGMFFSNCYGVHVWVMEQYGVLDSWTKRYKFQLDIGQSRCLMSNGELLFVLYGKGVRSYDAKKKLLKEVAKTYFNKSSGYNVYCFVESLVLLHSHK